jgi:hypothetical protein
MFSWEAFATLSAVIAAGWVGWNQVKIQRRQTILVENDLKIQLLDKRSACVKSMRELHNACDNDTHLSDENRRKFYRLSQDVVLLYPKDICKKLDSAVASISSAKVYYQRSQHYNNIGDKILAEKKLEQAYAEEDKVIQIMPDLLDELIEYSRVDAWK